LAHFAGSLAWLGISDDPALLGEPETGGCAERWIRTLKEQCLWAELHDAVDQLRQAVAASSTATTPRGSSSVMGTAPRRRPTRRHNQSQRHDE
jgi:hypothetical protein